MRVPESIGFAYDEAIAVVEPLAAVAGTRLRVMCAQNGWLFDDRIKSAESCLSKLESGGSPLSELHDLYATMVVVPTQVEIELAIDKILGLFDGTLKVRAFSGPENFAYDDVHVIARLCGKVSPRSVPNDAVLKRYFEIQVRTGSSPNAWCNAFAA